MKFKELETVKLRLSAKTMGKTKWAKRLLDKRGLVTKCNQSAFGETYWVQWDDSETLMHGSQLVKARFSEN